MLSCHSSPPTVSVTGVTAPAFTDITDTLASQYLTFCSNAAYFAADTYDGQLQGVLAQAIMDANTVAVTIFNSFSPTNAQGTALSSLVKLNGLERNIPTYSTVQLNLVGVNGTVLANCSAADTAGYVWTIPNGTTIPSSGIVTITATCTTPGAINAAVGTVTVKNTPTVGWQTVTNPTGAIPGSPVEDDVKLRERQASSTDLAAITPVSSLQANIGQLAGVTQVIVFENDTSATNGLGIPAHSIAVVLTGSPNATSLGEIIALEKTPGGQTYGTSSVSIADNTGTPHTYYYSTATPENINVTVSTSHGSGWTSQVNTQIAAAITAYINGLGIGQNVSFTKLYPAAYSALGSNPNLYEITGLSLNGGTSDVTIAYNQIAVPGTITVS